MTEFGHTARKVPMGRGFAYLDSWGAGPFLITVGDKTFRFEDSARFGPSLIRKNGDILATQPGGRSPFWKGHYAWLKQGRRLEEDGITCIWEPLKPTLFYKEKRGRKWFIEIVEEGHPDGEMIEVEP